MVLGAQGALVVSDFRDKSRSSVRAGGQGVPNVRRSPSGRIPQWAIDEAFGHLQEPDPWRAAPAPAKRRGSRPLKPRRVHGWNSKRATFVALAVLIGLSLAGSLVSRLVTSVALPYLPGAEAPPPGVEAASAPLGVPPGTTGSTAYVLPESPDPAQDFIAYDPCRPIHYVVRPDSALPGGDQLIREAVTAVSAASGLRFVEDGPTSEAPSKERKAYQPDLYGRKWAPVLITWSTPEESPDLAGNVAGTGGSSSIQRQGSPYVYVSGQITLDAPDLAETLALPDGPALVRATIMHELGHVVGLGHVNDSTQLMHAENSGQLQFGAGDRAGLALLGTGACVPQV